MEWLSGLPAWVLYALVGAIAGGAGGLLGTALERLGLRHARLLLVVAAVVLSPRLVDAYLQPILGKERLQRIPIIETLKEALPQESALIDKKLADVLSTSRTLEEARRRSYDLVAGIRRRYAEKLADAPQPALKSVLDAQTNLLRAIRDSDGPDLCARVAVHGIDPDDGRMDAYADSLEAAGTHLFQAIGSAIQTPSSEPASKATDEDWAALAKAFLQNGGTESELLLISQQQHDSRSYCDAVIKLLDAVNVTPEPSRRRLQVTFAMETASY